MRLPRLSFRHIVATILALPVLAIVGFIGSVYIEQDNFRQAAPNVYRSGQLRADEWQESFDRTHYRSVLNLRGAKPEQWYRHEVRFAAEHGLAHYDFELSAKTEPTTDQMRELVAVMRKAPKPLLIHCKNGSDRTGLVAALYAVAVEGRPADEASQQLSFWYGHFPWLGSKTVAMDKAFAEFVSDAGSDERGTKIQYSALEPNAAF